jgi:hypothetical protein
MTGASSHEIQDIPQLSHPPAAVRYGTDEHGRPAVYDIAGPVPHMLITGGTGYGRTTALRIILLEAARQGIDVRICDPKRVSASGLRGLPGITVATEPADIVRMAEESTGKMQSRYQEIEAGDADPDGYQRILLAADDYETLMCTAAAAGETVTAALDQIAIFGRGARISILVGALSPASIPPGMRDNFGTRLALGRPSRHQAQALFGDPQAGHDVPPYRPGTGVAGASDGAPVRVQVHWPGIGAGLPPLWTGRRRARGPADWLRAVRQGIPGGTRSGDRRAGPVSLSARWLGPPRRPSRGSGTLAAMSPPAEEAAGFLYLVQVALWGQRAHLAAAAGDGTPAGGDAAPACAGNTGTGAGPEPPGPCIGAAVPAGRVYLFPLADYQAARSMAGDLGAPFTLTYPQLEAAIRDSGLLQYEDSAHGRRHTVRRHVAGGLFRVWDLPADTVLGAAAAAAAASFRITNTGG